MTKFNNFSEKTLNVLGMISFSLGAQIDTLVTWTDIGFYTSIDIQTVTARENKHSVQRVPCTEQRYWSKRESFASYGSISPRKTVLSEEPEAIIGSIGWKSTSFTLPRWPGKR